MAVLGAVVGGLSAAEAVSGFVVTNTAMAVSFASCGLILATRRPANPIGWLFLADGLGHGLTAAAVPLAAVGLTAQWPIWLVRALITVGVYAWPWSISLFLPLALLLFPTGRLPSRRWIWLVWAAIGTAVLFVVDLGTEPSSPVPGGPLGYGSISGHERFAPVWTVAELCVLLLYAAGLVALAVRYRRGSELAWSAARRCSASTSLIVAYSLSRSSSATMPLVCSCSAVSWRGGIVRAVGAVNEISSR